ncbi:MAG: nuclear transport factor 2 family protein [Chitinophagaceae bacterium]|nr:nuclear transport factor 2 family protein [Chitinophagaceae bacterium]
MDNQNVETIKRAYQHFQQGNIEGLLQMFDDNINWEIPQISNVNFSGKRSGKYKVQEFFSDLSEQVTFKKFEPQEFVPHNGNVIVFGHYTGNVGATGKDYNSDWVHVFEVQNGKIKSFKEYSDSSAISEAFK